METHTLTCTLPTHHPSHHTGNALLLAWLRQCQCPSLAELRVQGGKCRAAFLLLTALSTSSFPMDSRVCRRQGWRLSALCIIPIRLRCQQVTRDWHFSYWVFSSSSLYFIHGNHSKCTVPSPDPTEVSEGAPVDPIGAGV